MRRNEGRVAPVRCHCGEIGCNPPLRAWRLPRVFGKGGDGVRKVVQVVSALLMVGGLAVLLAVNGADWYAQYAAERHIQSFTAVYSNDDDPERLEYKRQAQDYNACLAGARGQEGLLDYREQLFYQREPMMSYIEIPKIGVRQPIYHGTSDTELMVGVGHLETSSLPVGGQTAHCVLLGHSGMRNARMFDELDELQEGDEFVLWSLNEPYAYRVYGMEVVTPEVANEMTGLMPGRDVTTLVTCTPYGVNSHRLLVHGERCEYDREEVGDVGVSAYVNNRSAPLLVAVGAMIALGAVGALVRSIGKLKRKERSVDVDAGFSSAFNRSRTMKRSRR